VCGARTACGQRYSSLRCAMAGGTEQRAQIPEIEIEIGVFLLQNPAHYRDLEALLELYEPTSQLLKNLLSAFKQSIERDGAPQFVDKYLSYTEAQFWINTARQMLHLQVGDLSQLPKLRKYLENEGRAQQLRRAAMALNEALQRGAPLDTIKDYLFQIQNLMFREERALDLAGIVEFIQKLRDERERPKSHAFPYMEDVFGFPVHIYNKDLTVIMGRTGRGKTTMSLNLARSYIENGKVVCYISTEMDERAIATKFASIVAGVPWSDLWGKDFNEESAVAAATALRNILEGGNGGLFVFHAPACTPSDIAYAVSLARANYGKVDAVIVDYIQQVSSSYTYRSEETRAAELARITREIADIIVDCGAAGIIVSQVNAQGEVKDSRAVAERAALLVRLGMFAYSDFERYILYLLRVADKDAIVTADKRAALRALYTKLIDVEIVKNRYGSNSAENVGFIEWNPQSGQFLRAVTIQELKERAREILGGAELAVKQERKKPRKTAPSSTPSAQEDAANEVGVPYIDARSLNWWGKETDDEQTVDEFPF